MYYVLGGRAERRESGGRSGYDKSMLASLVMDGRGSRNHVKSVALLYALPLLKLLELIGGRQSALGRYSQ